MADVFIQKGKQKMRCGYTTGSCATGAVKACAEMIFTGRKVQKTAINTPKGIEIELDIHDVCMNEKSTSCSVVKYGGDDPDITNGIKIFAEVTLSESEIEIFGGRGVGKVTKEGLDQPVGEWAINSVPRKMIRGVLEEIAEKSGYSGGFRVVISVPEGEEIARKTYNSRMGILGGISIIGTSGLVEPMSSQALVDTIRAEASIRRCSGAKNMLLT
ncbi:MAG: cobalt-precorrin-5B (C(1))-methyltransferase CbiD, partial [Ruminococcus sp.]|nr:cobalt-precorrin-5B (C(1))-methyltransferase CbiD [Ruminococcus sp.]